MTGSHSSDWEDIIRGVIHDYDSGINSRSGLYFLKDAINPQPLIGTGFYSEEASIQGKMVYMLNY